MAILQFNGASIECEHSHVVSRDIKSGAFVQIPKIGRCLKYNCKRNSEAKITKELKPKTAKIKSSSNLDIDDTIKGEEIVVIVEGIKPLNIKVINFTSRHKAQQTTTNRFTYGEITQQLSNIKIFNDPIQLEGIKNLLNPKKVDNKRLGG